MKKLGIMQPYLFPYLAYFQVMKAVDQYVIYDDVQYIKGGWIGRNNVLMQGEKKLLSIRLLGASPNRLINEVVVDEHFEKFEKTIASYYARAPFRSEVSELLARIFSFPDKNLARFIANSFAEISHYLKFDTEFIMSSDLKKDIALKGQDKVLAICNELAAGTYINAIGGQSLYNREDFQAQRIKLKFLKSHPVVYRQMGNVFVPDLSIIDVMMFNSHEDVNFLLDRYELI